MNNGNLTIEKMEELYQQARKSVKLPWHEHIIAVIKRKLGMKLTIAEWQDLEND